MRLGTGVQEVVGSGGSADNAQSSAQPGSLNLEMQKHK